MESNRGVDGDRRFRRRGSVGMKRGCDTGGALSISWSSAAQVVQKSMCPI